MLVVEDADQLYRQRLNIACASFMIWP